MNTAIIEGKVVRDPFVSGSLVKFKVFAEHGSNGTTRKSFVPVTMFDLPPGIHSRLEKGVPVKVKGYVTENRFKSKKTGAYEYATQVIGENLSFC